ncbi:unnamed protein product [Urochloa decumbens]|uniref:Uncharacterized protein n=1 Tax=Urochloa decumbens TaxID=240449 RepID=A0ABC8VBC4_9POAL
MATSKKDAPLPAPGSSSSFMSVFAHADGTDVALMVLGLVGAMGEGLSTPVRMIIFSHIANDLGNGPDQLQEFTSKINENARKLIVLAFASGVMAFLEGYCWARTAERQASRMRTQYLRAVLRQDMEYFDLAAAGMASEVAAGVSSDSLAVQDALAQKVPNLVSNAAMFAGSYAVALALLPRLALAALPSVLLLVVPGLACGRALASLARRVRDAYARRAGAVAEQAVSSARAVYAFAAEASAVARFSAALEETARLGIKQGLVKGVAVGSNGVSFLVWAFNLWYGSRLVMYHGYQGGTVFAVSTAIVSGGMALGWGLSNVKYFSEASAAAERIMEVIRRVPKIDSESDAGVELDDVAGELEFKDVEFSYPSRPESPVLANFSLRVPAGSTVALVGASGSGKSTVIALLERFYDPSAGEVTLDGVDIRRLRLKWLRAQMGLVSQEPALFAMTIRENILFGKEGATDEEVVAAAKAANAHNFVLQLPQGYETQVGERGIQMSGGQKQRIAIARAILKSPKVLLFDEATSALDSKSERVVQEALERASMGRTTVIIAHCLSTIRNADLIAVMQSGEVKELGSHEDLIDNKNGLYSSLVHLQRIGDASGKANKIGRIGCTSLSAEKPSSHDMSRILCLDSRSIGDEGGEYSTEKPKLHVPSFKRLLMLNAPEWKHALVGSFSAVVFGGIQPTYAYVIGSMFSVYFLTDHAEIKNKTRDYTLIFVALAVLSLFLNIGQHYNFGAMGEYLTKRIREQILKKILTFEIGWFDRDENSTGVLCSMLAKDANIVRALVGDRMALVIQAQSKSSKLSVEAVSNLYTITAFSLQDRILHLFDEAQYMAHKENICQSWFAGLSLSSSVGLMACTWPLNFWYGGMLMAGHHITAKALYQTFMIIVSTGRVIADAGSMTTDLAKGAKAVASIFAILDRKTEIEPNNPKGYKPEKLQGDVQFVGVNFAYPSRPNVIILKEFFLSIQPGKSTSIVEQSGFGKSTIIGLNERFYDPLLGVVKINGRDIKLYNLRDLRRHIGLVSQEPTVFAGTIRENIMYGIDIASEAEIEEAARSANAHDFISNFKDGYDTWCGERGFQLSGGQKQRIAIARAILKNPAILLLDEATSALDSQSEKVVQEALDRVMMGRTSVVVAHMLNTVRKCDLIVVLEKGIVVEKGTHSSLMAKGSSGKYFGLVSLQQGSRS